MAPSAYRSFPSGNSKNSPCTQLHPAQIHVRALPTRNSRLVSLNLPHPYGDRGRAPFKCQLQDSMAERFRSLIAGLSTQLRQGFVIWGDTCLSVTCLIDRWTPGGFFFNKVCTGDRICALSADLPGFPSTPLPPFLENCIQCQSFAGRHGRWNLHRPSARCHTLATAVDSQPPNLHCETANPKRIAGLSQLRWRH